MLRFKEYLAIEEVSENLFESDREGIRIKGIWKPSEEPMQKPPFQPGVIDKAADIIINPISSAFYETGKLYKGLFNTAIKMVFRGIGEVSKPLINPVVAAIGGALKIVFDPATRLIQTQANFAHTTGTDEMMQIENEIKSRFPNNPQLQQSIMRSISNNLKQIQSQIQQVQSSTKNNPALNNIKNTIIQHLNATWKAFANEIKNYPMAIANAFTHSFKSEDFHSRRIPQEFQTQIEFLARQIKNPDKQRQFLQSMIELANRIIHEIPNN
jgi:hypothetical protein